MVQATVSNMDSGGQRKGRKKKKQTLEQRSDTGQRNEWRNARGTNVVLRHVPHAALPHDDRS